MNHENTNNEGANKKTKQDATNERKRRWDQNHKEKLILYDSTINELETKLLALLERNSSLESQIFDLLSSIKTPKSPD